MSAAVPRLAILGAGGQLGSDLVEVLAEQGGYRVEAFSRKELDVSDREAVEREITAGRYHAVINTAAMTNVDDCERHGEQALTVNGAGAYLVAQACAAAGSHHVLVGTDFVFAGDKTEPYHEADVVGPINVYGASKSCGETMSTLAHPGTLIVRISSVFGKAGSRGKGGNFIEAILGKARSGEALAVIDDIVMSPTYTRDVARALPRLLRVRASGIVHLANTGSCSWYEFARRALQLCGLEVPLEAVPASALPRPASRPRNSALTSLRTQELLGQPPRHWDEALREYLTEKGHLEDST